MNLLHLNVVTEVPSESGEEKIAKVGKPKTTENGLTAEWFSEQGLIVPLELQEDDLEYDQDGRLLLDEVDIEYDTVPCTIPVKNIVAYVEDITIGTIVYLKSGLYMQVMESVEEIDDYIRFLETSRLEIWWTIQKMRIKQLINKFKHVN